MAQINKSSEYFNTVLYTGNGSTNAITGVGFQPDWVWIKNRPDVREHQIYDSIRGVTKVIGSDRTSAEATVSNGLTAFGSDGFTVGSDANVNDSGDSHVSWNWLASNTTASNTDGSITSTVSANTTSGFSIVSFTGTGANATVGHGLGSAPEMIILKNRDSAENWIVGNTSLDWTKYLALNLTDATTTASNIWQNTAPTSSVFSIGDSGKVNGSGNGMVAYCFAEKKGFSKFGSYTGNGSTDGTFVYTGFKPAWVMIKCTSSGTTQWRMYDDKRDTYNPVYKELNANTSDAENASTRYHDFLSNGFKMRDTNINTNGSGSTYIFMAFAENPLVGTNNIPATAR
jgi:hypothetical protein